MLFKKIIGILIILLNIAGLGFLLYMAGQMIRDKFFPKKQILAVQQVVPKKKKPGKASNDIIPEDDDLLKDMDLSDLDDLNLDDFD